MPRAAAYRALACIVAAALGIHAGSARAQPMAFSPLDVAVPFGATVGTWPPSSAPGLVGWTSIDSKQSSLDMRKRGLLPLFVTADGIRDVRVVDLDGDGRPDIVGNAKSDTVPMEAQLRVFRNVGPDRYVEDEAFRALDLRGYGETLVVADFDNDGCPDIFNPQYTFQNRCYDIGRPAGVDCRPGAPPQASGQARQSYLLLNTRAEGRCSAKFREVAREAGVSMHAGSQTDPDGARPEGAQAIDFDGDGWLDLWAAGHLFINQRPDADGVPRFVDISPRLGLFDWNAEPVQGGREDGPGLPPDCDGTRLRFPIEEGAQLVDWNNDGRFDLVVHHWVCGPSLYELVQTPGTDSRFVQRRCAIGRTQCVPMFSSGAPRYEAVRFTGNYGVKLQDLDGDGLVDVVVRGRPREPGMSKPQGAIVYRNTGSAFESVDAKRLAGLRDGRAGSVAFADFDRDGRIDVVYPTRRGTRVLLNRSPRDRTAGTMYVEVLGANGERNQFGRVVAFDVPGIGRKIMRVVDGGSGYLAQDEYVVLAPTAVAAPHRASVAFRASPDVPNRIVEFDIRPGEFARVYEPSREHPRGRIEMSRMPPRQAK